MLLSKLILGARKGEIHLNDPNPIRDYLHVKDLCSAILDVSHISMQENYLIFNVASGETFTNLELAELIKDKINPKIKNHENSRQKLISPKKWSLPSATLSGGQAPPFGPPKTIF